MMLEVSRFLARRPVALPLFFLLALALFPLSASSQGYGPAEAAEKMTVPEGVEVSLYASEPMVRQPVAIEFDDRGRMWVVQYLQYPIPEGLSRVSVDRYSRAKYDKIPDPPPKGPKGGDKITILIDEDRDGVFERVVDLGGSALLTVYDQYADGGHNRCVETRFDGLTLTWTNEDRDGPFDVCVVTDLQGKQLQTLRWVAGTGFVLQPK